jgi:hypothetical protein
MDFILTGFHQDANVRQFSFQGIATDRTRTEFTVGADLGLIRKYQIPVQELPLLCRRLLEEHMISDPQTTVVFTEEDMRNFAKNRADAKEQASQRKKLPRRPPVNNSGRAWRAPGQH